MDNLASTASTPRPSAIPRPSRLPLPRPASSLAYKPPSPTRFTLTPAPSAEIRPKQSIGRQSLHGTVRGRYSIAPPPLPTPTRTASNTANICSSQHRTRQPLGPPLRPQSKQESRVLQQGRREDDAVRIKVQRPPSQQENTFEEEDDLANNEAAGELFDDDATPTLASKTRPRPSLSDRTIESLSHLPAAPGSSRRSSFFNPQSPMTPMQSPSAMSTYPVSKINYGTVRRNALPRPLSPAKHPSSAAPISTPARPRARRSVSSALPTSSLAVTRTPTLTKTVGSMNKSINTSSKLGARPASAAAFARPSYMPAGSRLAGLGPPRSQSSMKIVPPLLSSRPESRTKSFAKPSPPAEKDTSRLKVQNAASGRPTSSTELRSQIAHARAAHRNVASRPTGPAREVVYATLDFDACENPFNQQSERNDETLYKRVDAARRDGRLNIAALGLNCIPEEVLNMYDAEAMEQSSVTWSETVDLCRLNAADNEIEEIADHVFPDETAESLAQRQEGKGNQFGGVEVLDLHGNLMRNIPKGLRRHEMLTTLNLSRNKFDNTVFDIITQISSLRELRLAENDLARDVPESIGQLTKLETLDLHGNKLVLLPASLRELIHLRVFDVSDNRFSDLSMDSLVNLPSLVEVYASKNALTSSLFPSTVICLPKLQVLDVSNNSVASLSFSTALSLPALTHLDVSRNRLYKLPDLSTWSNLVTLLAQENRLGELPEGFTSLSALKRADFSRNDIKTCDVEVGKMAELEMLGLAGNPLREKRFLTMTTAAIKRELAKRLDEMEEAEAETF